MYCFVPFMLSIYVPIVLARLVGSVPEELGRCDNDIIQSDPANCHYYLQCVNNHLYRFHCGDQAVFDPHTRICTSPHSGHGTRCTSEMDRMDGVEKNQVSSESSERFKKHSSSKNSHLPDFSRIRCQNDGYFRDKTNCGKFYRCSSGALHVFSCPDGMAFNKNKSACDITPAGQECFHVPINRTKILRNGRRKIRQRLGSSRDQVKKNMTIVNVRKQEILKRTTTAPKLPNKSYKHRDGVITSDTSIKSHSVKKLVDTFPESDNTAVSVIQKIPSLSSHIKGQMKNKMLERYGVAKSAPLEELADEMSTVEPIFFSGTQLIVADQDRNTEETESNIPRLNPLEILDTEIRVPANEKDNSATSDEQNLEESRAEETSTVLTNVENTADSIKGSLEIHKNLWDAPPVTGSNWNPMRRSEDYKFIPRQESSKRESSAAHDAKISQDATIRYLGDIFYGGYPCVRNGYYRDPFDCARFYQCSNGMAYHQKCNQGLVFSVRDGICDWPYKVPECDERPSSYNRHMAFLMSHRAGHLAESELDLQNIDTKSPKEIHRNENEKVEYICEPGTKRPDPENCGEFYSCVTGNSEYKFKCPGGMAFHTSRGVCLDIDQVPECDIRDPGNDDTNRPADARNLKKEDAKNSEIEDIPWYQCPPKDGFFRDKNDCSIYYACTNGQLTTLTCPTGFVFNEIRNLCDLPTNVPICMTKLVLDKMRKSIVEKHKEMGQGRSEDGGFPCPEDGLFPHPNNCQVFVECYRGKASEITCGMFYGFDANRKACVPLDNLPGCESSLISNDHSLENYARASMSYNDRVRKSDNNYVYVAQRRPLSSRKV